MPRTFNNPLAGLQAREAFVSQTRENSSRLAWSFGKVTTTGWGEFSVATMVRFQCSFIEEPYMHYGYNLNDVDDNALVEGFYPRSFGFVRDYETVQRGSTTLYVGAYVACIIDMVGPVQFADLQTYETLASVKYNLDHYFTFAGMAMKDLPEELLEQ